jgi:hypothetical protein
LGLNQLNFPPKWCDVGLALICATFLVLDFSLHLGSSNHEAFLWALFFGLWLEPIEFPSKMVRCKFSLDLRHFLILDLSLYLGSPNHELSFCLSFFLLFVGLNQLNFLPKWCNDFLPSYVPIGVPIGLRYYLRV